MADKNKKSMKNTFKNIPTGARITITIMAVFGIAAATYTFTSFGSDTSNPEGLGPVSQSTVQLGSKEAEGYKVGANKVIDEKSPLAEQERQARAMELEKAKKEAGGGYMAPFQISASESEADSKGDQSDFIDGLLAEVDRKAEVTLDSEKNKRQVPNGLDDVMNREQEELARKERLARMENDIAQSKMAMEQGGIYDDEGRLLYNSQGQKIIYQTKKLRAYDSGYGSNNEQAAQQAQEEIDSAKVVSQRLIAQAAELTGVSAAQYGGSAGGSSASGSADGLDVSNPRRKYNPANDPTNEAFYAPYVNQDRHIPQPDYEGLNNTREQVAASMRSSGVPGAQELGFGGGSGGSYASNPGQHYQVSSYGSEPSENYEYGYTQSTLNRSEINPDLPYKALGDVCYGKLKMNVNSDAPTPVRVQFLDRRCGKLYNKIAVAAPARTGEFVTLEFKGINVKGKTQAINAIALDPESESALFQDSLDRHIFSRYLSLAAAAALPGWSEAVTGTRVEEDSNGDETKVQAPVEALSDQLAVVAGSIGEALTPVLQQNFERPPTVKVYNNKDILIMFMGDFFIE